MGQETGGIFINKITDHNCTGCGACFSICPTNAIEMKKDAKGFLYPSIDAEKCIECKLCQKICPLNVQKEIKQSKGIAYAAYSMDDSNRRCSSSGGVFSLLGNFVLEQDGAVYGAAFSKDFKVEHQRVTENILPLQTSKYVQSNTAKTFEHVELDLCSGKKVLYSGTPCQVGGLYSYLAKKKIDMTNLVLVDLICHGVPSPMLWETHLKKLAKGRKITQVNFRDKRLSWGNFCLSVKFEDGTEYCKAANNDIYMSAFLANLTLRESCHDCDFKSVNRVSDITIADYWGVEKYDPEMGDGKGTSAVIIHTDKGLSLFDQIKPEIRFKGITIDSILNYNKAMIESATQHPRRKAFWNECIKDISNYDFYITKFLKPTLKEKIKMGVVKIKRIGKKLLKR